MYMFTTTISLTNSSVMNIVGVSTTKETGTELNNKIINTYRKGSIDELVEVMKQARVNVYMDETPYAIYNITETREKLLKIALDDFINNKGGKFKVGACSVLPINLV